MNFVFSFPHFCFIYLHHPPSGPCLPSLGPPTAILASLPLLFMLEVPHAKHQPTRCRWRCLDPIASPGTAQKAEGVGVALVSPSWVHACDKVGARGCCWRRCCWLLFVVVLGW